jgi:hypothetical protein
MSRPAANETIRWKRRITIGLWWLALYLLILYLAFRFGGHPASPDRGWISS